MKRQTLAQLQESNNNLPECYYESKIWIVSQDYKGEWELVETIIDNRELAFNKYTELRDRLDREAFKNDIDIIQYDPNRRIAHLTTVYRDPKNEAINRKILAKGIVTTQNYQGKTYYGVRGYTT